MREWRKLHISIVTSERLASVSDSAKWLFTLLVVCQDDEGKYPWTEPRIKALVASTDWDRVATESLATQLRVAGVSELRDGFMWLQNGVKYNGTPHNSKSHPKLYPPVSELESESAASRQRVGSESEATTTVSPPTPRGEEIREEEKRGEGGGEKSPPTPPLTIPEHFTKLTELPGFNRHDHSKAFENIEMACAAAGANVAEVVVQFSLYYQAQRFRHGWKDPVKALAQTVHIEIAKLLRPTNHQRPKDNFEKLKELERGASRGRPVESI